MLKILSTVTLVLMLILLPPSVLMYASNNAVPGQTMYPVKRWLESGILAIASLTPNTKAYFSISQTEWRFNETTILLSSGMDASGSLTDLVDQTEQTAANINNISSTEEKSQLISKLSNSIDHYQVALQTAAVSDAAVNYQPLPSSTPKSAYQLIKQNQPKVSPKAPIIKPTPSSSPVSVTQPSQPSPPPVVVDNSQLQAILEAQRKLEELKKQLEQRQKQLQNQLQTQRTNVAVSPSPKATPSPSVSPQPTYTPSPITTNSQDLYQSNVSPIPTPTVSVTKEPSSSPSPNPSPSAKSNKGRSSSNSNSDHED